METISYSDDGFKRDYRYYSAEGARKAMMSSETLRYQELNPDVTWNKTGGNIDILTLQIFMFIPVFL